MLIKEIKEYREVKEKARTYLCYIMSSNISQATDAKSLDGLLENLNMLKKAIPKSEVVYALDGNGIQMTPSISQYPKLNGINKGKDKSNRSYFYATKMQHRCEISDPYPSIALKHLVVTASFPIYDTDDNLLTIICVQISLKDILRMVHPNSANSLFSSTSKIVYSLFSLALFFVAILLFIKGVDSLVSNGINFYQVDINDMFKSTILLTLSLAIVDLVKAIFEEEVLGKEKKDGAGDTHQTMVRFLGSIIIALSIEALMLVFKFALNDPSQLIFAVYLILGVTALIIGLSYYLKVSHDSYNR
ncbi:N-linked glycosylation glycosyltransferase PglG [hydrothermal vent metagenome]|uniref:N-linked glycosylation glycosyltransferase PglG n=1 Tax=hydrothermal vent metagenome TaxID=652676 RepID=A0A1W1BSU6_9ZZZZ